MKQLVSFLSLAIFGMGVFAQSNEIPMDPEVRTGVLKNGLTYYIKHNEEPKERASFYIIQNVGAILENDEQNGLAHFLEHMAFNGTKNFPKKGIIEYLEKYGVAFGRNINAYTAQDETVYNLSGVPTTHEPLIDSCLLVLNDWSNYLSLEGLEIDAERGVIGEEWRTRRDAGFRMRAKFMPVLLNGSKYGKRDVIGDLEVIKNFDHKVLRDFYHDWYRTDLQAIAIVGDVNVDEVEKKVKDLFSKIPAVKNAKERYYVEVPFHAEPNFIKVTDKEQQGVNIAIMTKYKGTKREDKNKLDYWKDSYTASMFTGMVNTRLRELTQKENPPFINASVSYRGFLAGMNSAGIDITPKGGDWKTALGATLVEVERARRFGITDAELERMKSMYLASIENQYKQKDKIDNDNIAKQLKSLYIDGEPVASVEFETEFARKFIPTITKEDVNKWGQKFFKKENTTFLVMAPEEGDIATPSKDELLVAIDGVQKMPMEAYVDDFAGNSLVGEIKDYKKIVSQKELKEFDATEYTLGNGLKFVIKKTDFNKDQILMSASSFGGSSVFGNDYIPSIMLFGDFIGAFGLGDFSAMQLQKALTGKIVKVGASLNGLSEGFSGSSSPKDFETMLQLTHLYFNNPRFDEQAYNALMARYIPFVQNMPDDPNRAFGDTVGAVMSNYHPRQRAFGMDVLNEASFDKIKEIYLDRFQDADDFTFFFTGNIDEKTALPLIEKYLGSVKSNDRKDNFVDNKVSAPAKGKIVNFEKSMETAKSTVFVSYYGNSLAYNFENRIKISLLAELLNKRYLEEIREKEGGTYGVSVRPSLSQYPEVEFNIQLKFDCDPEKADKLKSIAIDEIHKLVKSGVIADDLKKAKENMLKNRTEAYLQNNFWHSQISSYYYSKQAPVLGKDYEALLNGINAKDMQKFAKKLFKKAQKVEVVMKPSK